MVDVLKINLTEINVTNISSHVTFVKVFVASIHSLLRNRTPS